MIDQQPDLEASERCIFIISWCTECSTDYFLLTNIWLSVATVLQGVIRHLSTYIAANHDCSGEWQMWKHLKSTHLEYITCTAHGCSVVRLQYSPVL